MFKEMIQIDKMLIYKEINQKEEIYKSKPKLLKDKMLILSKNNYKDSKKKL